MAQEHKFGDDQNSAQTSPEQYLRRENFEAPTPKASNQQPLLNREPIKHLLIGSPKAVTSTIHYLQAISYAEVGDWSPLIPTENPDQVMSILIRHILVA
ncbi:hypothetical protein IQ244_02370 [Nostoc sp. LEGE 06077]|uniref:hypothetical protein n=1 Tax=Nostoc sp. LEGE 06077 TaxID=915325 RepID=UPI00188281AA|nr:hypothetical protein [Nostoc sp. LEGE 06077]MBE9205394.1 hypothetical protein [Nostoc sp. LEGE 06077]